MIETRNFKIVLQIMLRTSSSRHVHSDGIPLTSLSLPHFCACLKPRHGFPTSYAAVFFMFNVMINNSTNINKMNFHLSPSSLNSDGQQFHQYQQNELSPLTFKFKQWWSTISPISTKQTVSYNFKSLNIKVELLTITV
jgi:hypothetical protein